MGLNSRKSGQPALGRAASRSQGAACVCVGLVSSPALSSCVLGGARVAARVQRAPALPCQACPCVSSLSWVCLGWAGEEHPLLLCWVGADGEESPPFAVPAAARGRWPALAVWLQTRAWLKAAVPAVQPLQFSRVLFGTLLSCRLPGVCDYMLVAS